MAKPSTGNDEAVQEVLTAGSNDAPTGDASGLMPVVAIVGRPNVGKSTLFNRLAGQRRAVVADEAGTTRDRVIMPVEGITRRFFLVDTGGIAINNEEPLWGKIYEQVRSALADADVIIFLTDAIAGLQPADSEIADSIRRIGTPIITVVNKNEGERRRFATSEFFSLGLGEPISISAIKGEGIDDLLNEIEGLLPPGGDEKLDTNILRLAIVGRPNVGKSSLLNTITGEERAIVHDVPGTTRDSLDSWVSYEGKPLMLIDTAGIRKRGHIEPGPEKFSALRSIQAIERCNVAILVIDAEEIATAQDIHVAGYVLESYHSMVVAINKWDLADEFGLNADEVVNDDRKRLHWAPYVPIHFISALTGEGIPALLKTAQELYAEQATQVKDTELNIALMDALAKHPPPSKGRRHLRLLRGEQKHIHPLTFTIYVNNPEMVHFSYQRYLMNTIRTTFHIRRVPVRLEFRKGMRKRST